MTRIYEQRDGVPVSTLAAETSAGAGDAGRIPQLNSSGLIDLTMLSVFTSAAKGVAPLSGGGTANYLRADGTWAAPSGATSGTVTTVSIVTANGVSGTVANPGTTPAITLALGVITPTSVAASGTVTGSNLSGANTGDQTITLTGDVTGSGTGSFAATIANGTVTLAKQANMATASVVYRKTAGSGAPEIQTLATLKADLGLSGTNSGDQTSIVGITGTKAQFDTACTDGNFLYVGDVTQYTDEMAQDAVGGMVDGSLVYVDATPLLTRAALTGDATAAQGSNAVTVVKINGVALSGLATGILKNTTTTGTPSIAVAGDFPTLNQNTSGSAATLTTPRNIDGQAFDGSAAITVIAPGTHAATSKATPVDADELPLVDSAASNVLKKLTWANLKATLKTYFDTLYLGISATAAAATKMATARNIAGNSFDGTANISILDTDLSGTAWTVYAPGAPTPQAGVFVLTTTTGRYKQIGKTVFVSIQITLTSVGTATGFFTVALPVTAATTTYYQNLSGGEIGVFLCAVNGFIASAGTTALVLKYDGTSIITNGATITLEGVYEAA